MGVLMAFVVGQVTIILVYLAKIYHFTSSIQLVSEVHFETAMNAVIATTDLLIAAALVWLLAKNRSTLKRTNSIINRLILYTVASGLITGFCAIATLVTTVIFPDTFIYLTLNMIMVKCALIHTLSLMDLRVDIVCYPQCTQIAC